MEVNKEKPTRVFSSPARGGEGGHLPGRVIPVELWKDMSELGGIPGVPLGFATRTAPEEAAAAS